MMTTNPNLPRLRLPASGLLLFWTAGLLVSTETGELVLLAADSRRHRELGRFQAIAGKTWNHPVVRGSRVYLRNAQEMAGYSLYGGRLSATR